MEILIFAVAGLVMLVVFLGVSALPAVIAYVVGRLSGVRSLRWVLPSLAIGLPIAWASAGYATFKAACSSLPAPEFVSAPAVAPDGILSDSLHISASDLIERGVFRFVEKRGTANVRRDFAGVKKYPTSRTPVETEFVPTNASKAEYVVTESLERHVDRWWNPPIHTHIHQVKEAKTGRLLAQATDLVFGGGILGPYMRLIGGDQDFKFVSCGYASEGVGAWRPSLSSRPRFAQYREADAAFLVRALNASR